MLYPYDVIFSQETQRLMADPVPGISAIPDEQNARYFHVIVAGQCGWPREVLDGGVSVNVSCLMSDGRRWCLYVECFQLQGVYDKCRLNV